MKESDSGDGGNRDEVIMITTILELLVAGKMLIMAMMKTVMPTVVYLPYSNSLDCYRRWCGPCLRLNA